MLKLVQCEFAKLKRKKIIPLVFLSAFLFPIPITFLMATPRTLEKYPNKSVLFDGLFNMVMGYGVIFLLPCIIGVIAAMLFFMERDNDTFKNLRTIPVTSTQMIMAKIIRRLHIIKKGRSKMAKKKTQIPKYGTITLKGIQYYRTRITDADGKELSLYAATCEELY